MRLRRRALPAAVAVLLVTVIGWYVAPSDSPDVYGGLPRPQAWGERLTTHALHNPGFTVGYSEWYRTAVWVAYHAQPRRERRIGRRPEHFEIDSRTLVRVSSDDYRNSGYDRGHLAPNYLIARLFGSKAQRSTFLMSNVAPQTPRLNQLLWQRIEEAEADNVLPRIGDLWVVTGPVFTEPVKRLPSGVAVPAAFYRIWLDARSPQHFRALAFIAPQRVCGDEPLSDYVVTIADVEKRTGLDFFSAIEDGEEKRLETSPPDAEWKLAAYDKAPARYADNFRGLSCKQ